MQGTSRGIEASANLAILEKQPQSSVLEWNYTFRFKNSAFFFEPDMQYIIRPGGTGNIPNALVVGAQVGINF